METLPPLDVEARAPVWDALSELFLDTSLIPDDINRISKALAASPYSLEALDEILQWEVYPACHTNLWWIAGEWMAFDREWLQARIQKGSSPVGRLFAATLGRLGVRTSIEWKRIKHQVVEERNGH